MIYQQIDKDIVY